MLDGAIYANEQGSWTNETTKDLGGGVTLYGILSHLIRLMALISW